MESGGGRVHVCGTSISNVKFCQNRQTGLKRFSSCFNALSGSARFILCPLPVFFFYDVCLGFYVIYTLLLWAAKTKSPVKSMFSLFEPITLPFNYSFHFKLFFFFLHLKITICISLIFKMTILLFKYSSIVLL